MTVTLITGANKGIGFETARQLIELGHVVYIGARDTERGEKAAAEVGARFTQLDVTDDASVANALATIASSEGQLDVLVHNAGVLEAVNDGPSALKSFDTNAVGIVRSRRQHFHCFASPPTRSSSLSRAAWVPSGPSPTPNGQSSRCRSRSMPRRSRQRPC